MAVKNLWCEYDGSPTQYVGNYNVFLRNKLINWPHPWINTNLNSAICAIQKKGP